MGEPKPVASLSSGLLARKGHAKPAMRPQGFGGFGGFGGQDDLGWNDMGHDAPRPVAFPNGAELDVEKLASRPVPPVVRQREELAEEFSATVEPLEAVVDTQQDEDIELDIEDSNEDDVFDEDVFEEESFEEEGDPAFDAPVLTTRRKFDEIVTAAHQEPVIDEPAPMPAPPVVVPPVAVARAKKAVRARKGKAAFTLRLDPERHLKLKLACAIERVSAQTIVTAALDQYLAEHPELDDLARKVPASATK